MAGVNRHKVDKSDNGVRYFISAADLRTYATKDFRKPHGFFKINALVLPIKLRFNNKQPGGEFSFEQSISVGPAISIQRSFGGAFGTTSTSGLFGLDITNVNGDDKTVPAVLSSKTTLMGLTPFVGFNWEYRGINFSILSGIDILTGKAGHAWAYRNSPWFGVSIGGSLFSTEDKSNNQ